MYKHISGYTFIKLQNLQQYQKKLVTFCQNVTLKGTILLSREGININVSGNENEIDLFKKYLLRLPQFSNIIFYETATAIVPFKRLKIKIKTEIIAFREPKIKPEENRAKCIHPQILCRWLDEKKDIVLLDTRNDYEIRLGTFINAINLKLKHFTDFKKAANDIKKITPQKPIVTFCTGGIRCEKAALLLETLGFNEVYQLEGGILNYFNRVGHKHYQGECFVFDNRMVI